MKTKKLWRHVSIVVTVLLLLVSVGAVLGQEPDPDEGSPPAIAGEPAEFPDEVDRGTEDLVEPARGEAAAAQPPYTMNYQGYLTDGSGNPLDGTYSLTFSLYDAATGGAKEWGSETHNSVQVSKGLFHVILGESVTLYPNDFDEALFLQVEVDGTAMSTRQPVRTVAYAFGLVPGAEVEGDPAGSSYALYVHNTGTASNDRGLYASGEQYGIYAEEVGDGDIGIYSPDFVRAQGYKSTSDSYLWVPGINGVSSTTSPVIVNIRVDGSARLEASSTGSKYFHIPVTVPSLLYGQEVRVERLTVYYRTTNSRSYITSTDLRKVTGAASADILISDATNRTSTTSTSYSLTPTGNYTLTASSGALNARLTLYFGNTADEIYVGGVRLRLGHTD